MEVFGWFHFCYCIRKNGMLTRLKRHLIWPPSVWFIFGGTVFAWQSLFELILACEVDRRGRHSMTCCWETRRVNFLPDALTLSVCLGWKTKYFNNSNNPQKHIWKNHPVFRAVQQKTPHCLWDPAAKKVSLLCPSLACLSNLCHPPVLLSVKVSVFLSSRQNNYCKHCLDSHY